MEIKAVPVRDDGRREGIVGRREAGCGRVAEGFSIRVAVVAKGLSVCVSCKQVRE